MPFLTRRAASVDCSAYAPHPYLIVQFDRSVNKFDACLRLKSKINLQLLKNGLLRADGPAESPAEGAFSHRLMVTLCWRTRVRNLFEFLQVLLLIVPFSSYGFLVLNTFLNPL